MDEKSVERAIAKDVFEILNAVNVNGHTEGKKSDNGKELTYLSWCWAWAEVKKRYPDADYNIWRDEKGLPYVYDPLTGYMVFTDVTIEGITHKMWLCVMNGANKAMKGEPYTYDTKYKKNVKVEAATMFDINKTLMRCLTKNLAMFGLGLYIYAGEDLPEGEDAGEDLPEGEDAEKSKANKARAGESRSEKKEEPPRRKKPETEPLICEDCGNDITPIVKNGKVIKTPEEVAKYTAQEHGRCLCWGCHKEALRAEKEARDEDMG